MKKMLAILAITAASILASGCRGTVYVSQDPFLDGWYNVWGDFCGWEPGPGCNYYWDGLKIIDVEDPYYYTDYDWYVYYSNWYGETVYESPSGIIYDAWGNALNKDGASISMDALDVEESVMKERAAKVGEELALMHGVTKDTGTKIALALNQWAELGKAGGRNTAKTLSFVESFYGLNEADLLKAADGFKSGDEASVNEVVGKVAHNWNESPEAVRSVINSLHADLIEKLK